MMWKFKILMSFMLVCGGAYSAYLEQWVIARDFIAYAILYAIWSDLDKTQRAVHGLRQQVENVRRIVIPKGGPHGR